MSVWKSNGFYTTSLKENNFEIFQLKTDKDHVHLLVDCNPTQSILEVVGLLKQVSTFRMWRQNTNHKWLVKHFWKEKPFRSNGYFACSIGNISKTTAEKYIQSQG